MAKILIFEDEPAIITVLEFLMSSAGYTAKISADGDNAIEKIHQFAPDCIILDVMLPIKNGYDILQEITSTLNNPPPIIMLTAKMLSHDINNALSLGADAVITKPFANDVLMAKIKQLIGSE